MTARLPKVGLPDLTYRLVPSRFPPVPAFATVAAAKDLQDVMDLEGWTNDRIVQQRLARLPQSEWVFGSPCASIVMAAFLHAAPTGLRFSSGDLGAWYAGLSVNTSIAEVAHHLRREGVNCGRAEMRGEYRAYVAHLDGSYVDIRGASATRPELYAPASYAASQVFGEAVRASSDDGIVYDSIRHAGGSNVVCYRPRHVRNVQQTAHYEITVRRTGKIAVRQLSGTV